VAFQELDRRLVSGIPGSTERDQEAGVDEDSLHWLLFAAEMLAKQALAVPRHVARALVAAHESLGSDSRSDRFCFLREKLLQRPFHGFALREP
jgi:hypothetical protein